MDDALLIDENGDKVVYAKDLSEEDKALYFVCPECKTRVDLLTNVSTQKSHFRHHRKLIKKYMRDGCERYKKQESSNSFNQIHTATGFKIRLEYLEGEYRLLFCFHQFDRDLIPTEASFLKISTGAGYTVEVPVENLCAYPVNVKLGYISTNTYETSFLSRSKTVVKDSNKYLRCTAGFTKNTILRNDEIIGNLFRYNNDYSGLRIPIGSELIVGDIFYCMVYESIFSEDDSLKIEKLGVIKSSKDRYSAVHKWYIYSIQATESTDYSRHFFSNLGMLLVKKESKCEFIWPPLIEENYEIYNDNNESLFFYRNSLNNNLKQCSLVKGREVISDTNIRKTQKIFEVKETGNYHIIGNGKSFPATYSVHASTPVEILFDHDLELIDNNGDVVSNPYEIQINRMKYKDIFPAKIYKLRNNIVLQSSTSEIDKITRQDRIVFDKGAMGYVCYDCRISLISISSAHLKDLDILEYKGRIVKLPYWLRQELEYRASELEEYNRRVVRLWLRNNRVPLEVLKRMRGYYE